MNDRLSCYLVILVALLACGCESVHVAEKKPRPVTTEELEGTWVGLTEDSIYYFRVNLQRGGKGLCAYAYLYDEAELLAVEDWHTEASKIRIAVTPIDRDANQIEEISGSAHATIMEVIVVGKGWQRKLVLRREADMERRAGLVKTRMEQHKTKSASWQ